MPFDPVVFTTDGIFNVSSASRTRSPVSRTRSKVAPTPGSLQLKPAAGVTEKKLHPPLTGSFSVTVAESLGPKFVRVMVKETFVSGSAVLGPVLFTEMSLLGGVVVVAVLESFALLGSVGEVTVAVFGNDVFGGALSGI